LALSLAAAAKGEGSAAAGLAAGTLSSAQRVFFKHTRAEEASADQAALRYLASAGIPPTAFLEVFDLFRGQEALRPGRQDPYARTHPLTKDRQRAVKGYAAAYKTRAVETPATTRYWFDRMNAKMEAFLRNPRAVLRAREAKGPSEIATLRRAVAYHRQPRPQKALSELSQLLKMRPRDPYYHELRGQVLLESGQPAPAVQSYRNAVSLGGNDPLLLAGLGRALLGQNSKASVGEALKVLSAARGRDPGNPSLLRDLAVAHAKAGQNAMASVATAERYLVIGRFPEAQLHAKRALGALPRGSRGWMRAHDVEIIAKPSARRR
jgi:predicted Zn-dependent protease